MPKYRTHSLPKEELYRLYHEEKWSQQEIAKIFGCHRNTVHRNMVRLGIPVRTPKEGWAAVHKVPTVPEKTLRRLYLVQRKSQAEIASLYGCSASAVGYYMKKFGVPARKGKGENSCHWIGEEAGYHAKHIRLYSLLGQPSECKDCGTTEKSKRYEWANLTGDFGNPRDYQRLCCSCHQRYDRGRRVHAQIS